MSRDHSQNHYGPNASFDGYDSDLASAGILIDSLQQQLANATKQNVMLREALEKCRDQQVVNTTTFQIATKALAASVDLENVRLCEKEPVAWLNNGEAYPYPEGLPLYRAWEPKP